MSDVFQAPPPVLDRLCSVFIVTLFGVLFVPASAHAQRAALESVHIGTGKTVRLKTALEAGELFLLKASGAVQVGTDQVDAGSGGFGTGDLGQDGVAVTGIGPDGNVSSQHTPAQNLSAQTAPKQRRWFSGGRSGHTYYRIISGAGQAPAFRLLTRHAETGKSVITISVFRLSPAPAPLPPLLETVQVPVLERTVATSLTTRPSVLYLLQASGSGRVGGGGLGQGDAEYMDYKADGTGAEDIGDANTDYGLGVDEADQRVSPRRYKWGTWRKDHTYYLLFAGTGQPIHFFFYDVKGGYGDNSPTDTLTVKIFPVP